MATMHKHLSAANGPWAMHRLRDMDGAQFRQWQQLLEQRTGITVSEERRSFLETNLGIRMREIGVDSYQDYYEHIVSGPAAIREWTVLVDRLTVQETRFFRDPDAFRLVADYVLTRPRDQFRNGALEAWSVGCSTGEEPYTLAITLNECMTQLGLQPLFGITGSDISQPALAKASQGQFNARSLQGMDNDLRSRYFQPAEQNTVKVIDSLRERVCFARLNVLNLDKVPMQGMNIIFCQNLLIYFRRWRRREIVKKLAGYLAPGGLLVLGQGELTDWQPPGLQRVPSEHVLAWTKRRPDEE
ncbi:MAG: protein-glutamate O-methyltransferase CheR [Alteromonadaceae bacterium]|nr:protein-glutamate O-methyltransferase CheR [Alteromonadaceae bacterium]